MTIQLPQPQKQPSAPRRRSVYLQGQTHAPGRFNARVATFLVCLALAVFITIPPMSRRLSLFVMTLFALSFWNGAAWAAHFTNGPSMHIARYLHTATLLLDGRVLVFGGVNGLSNHAEIYNPAAREWVFAGPPGPDFGHTATRLNDGRVLTLYETSAQLFNPTNGTWTPTSSPNFYRRSHQAVLLTDGRVMVTGGIDAPSKCEAFDPTTSTWTNLADLKTTDVRHTYLLPSGRILAMGGTAVQLYDPATNAWVSRTPLPAPFGMIAAGVLANGQLLALTSFQSSPGASLYDPVNDVWQTIAANSAARSSRPVLLPNGGLLVAGGRVAQATADLYNPLTRAWTNAGGMTIARRNHTCTVLPDGSVFIVGGDVGASDPADTTEFYTSTNEVLTPVRLAAPVLLQSGMVQVTFTNAPGIAFGVIASTNTALSIGEWTGLNTLTETAPGQYLFTDSATNQQRFYSVRAP